MKIKPYMKALHFPDNRNETFETYAEAGWYDESLDGKNDELVLFLGSSGHDTYVNEGILEWWVAGALLQDGNFTDITFKPKHEKNITILLKDLMDFWEVPEYEIIWRNRYDEDESDVFITLKPLPADEEKLWKSYWENKRGDKSCSHEDLSIKTMEVLNGELLLTLDCDKCGKRTSTSASLNQGWEAEDLNTWAQQELSSHGQNVSFKNWAKKEVKSHGNIDLVDWAKHEKQSHTKKYGVESFSLDSKKADIINMEEPVIEEPSFIPDGDGRAIGQQNSSINLSPLHAEFDREKEMQILILEEELKELRAFKKLVSDTVKQQQGPHLRAMLKELLTMDFNAESFGADFKPTRHKKKGWVITRNYEDYMEATKGNRHIEIHYNKGDYEPYIMYRTTGSGEYFFKTLNDALDWLNGDYPLYEGGKDFRNAESEAATYSPSSSPDMVNEIQTSPTNESPQLFNASNTFNVTSALGISGLVVAALSLPMLYSSAKSRLGKSAEEKRKASGSVRRNHTQVKNSEYSVGQVNPVEAEGQQDIHGAEGITNPRHAPSASPAGYPSKTLKMW